MKRALSVLCDTLHTLALSLWLGGTLIIGACVAPAAFHIPGLTRLQSGMVVGESLRRFGPIILVCAILMLGAQFLTRRRYQASRPLYLGDGVRQLLTFGALMLAEYGRQTLFPAMDAARAANRQPDFDHLHHLFSSLAMTQVWLLIGIAALTAWIQSPQAIPGANPAAARMEPPRSAARSAQKPVK